MSKTLLLADDSITIQKVVGLSFASEDVTVIAVDNGDDAITRTREERPDVVLADVVMPGKNGYEVCEAIKADSALAHIPVLLLTGTFEAFDEARAKTVGAAGHIAKPFEAQALVDEVWRLFEASSRAQQSSTTENVEAEESVAVDNDAFDFFDEEPAAQANDSSNMDINAGAERSLPDDDSLFEFGSDSFSSTDAPADSNTPAALAEPVEELITPAPEDRPSFENSVITDADAAIEHASLTSAEALLSSQPTPDDSLAPSTSASSDDPFDFSFEPPASQPSIDADTDTDTDPLDGIDPLDSVGAEDLAQATVLDPHGASGYDVSSSDLDPAAALDSSVEPTPDVPQDWAASPEPDATVLAPEFQIDDADDTDDADLLEAELLGPDSQGDEPNAVVTSESSEPFAAGEPLVDSEPSEQPRVLSPEAAAQAESVLENIEPLLREQLHDTLEKIAWESFGSLTEQVVEQAVKRIEAIAWEVIPQLAETLIQEEIRRMKGTPPNDD